MHQELTKKTNSTKKDMHQRYQESLQNCQQYFDQKMTLSREPVDMDDQDMDTPSIIEYADNSILSRDLDTAPAQERFIIG